MTNIIQTGPASYGWNGASDYAPGQRVQASDTEGTQSEDSPSTVVTLSGAQPTPDGEDNTKGSTTADDGSPSAAKSFTYGVLGLGTPKSEAEVQAESPEKKETEGYYTAGRAVVAALTIGTLLAVI
jgi:hypothetical protein